MRFRLLALLTALALDPGVTPVTSAGEHPVPDEATLRAMNARFAPVDLGADLSGMPASEREALGKIIEAGRIIGLGWTRAVVIATAVAVALTISACSRTVSREPWETAPLAQEPVERTRLDGVAVIVPEGDSDTLLRTE